jgi:hypothetical protein
VIADDLQHKSQQVKQWRSFLEYDLKGISYFINNPSEDQGSSTDIMGSDADSKLAAKRKVEGSV